MKVNWNTKYNTICVYTFILVCSIILFYLSISQLGVLWGKIGKVLSLLTTIYIWICYCVSIRFFIEIL